MEVFDDIWHGISLDWVRKVCEDPSDERQLLDLLGRDPGDLYMTHALKLLRRYGLPVCIPVVHQMLEHSNSGVRREALATIALFEKANASDTYRMALSNKRFRDKGQAVYLLYKYGDAAAVPDMVKRLRRTFPKRPRVYLFNTGESELTQIIAYLWRHRDTNPDLTKVFRLVEANWSMLKPEEQA